MKPKEKEFCRMMALCGEPERAAREAGYRHPQRRWQELLCREDIAREIKRCAAMLKSVYENNAVSGMYRLAFGRTGDALRLLYHEDPTDEELDALDLSSVAEIKRTKDKSMEIKFFDRVKAFDKLNESLHVSAEQNSAGGLIEAMRLSAQALRSLPPDEGDPDGD